MNLQCTSHLETLRPLLWTLTLFSLTIISRTIYKGNTTKVLIFFFLNKVCRPNIALFSWKFLLVCLSRCLSYYCYLVKNQAKSFISLQTK